MHCFPGEELGCLESGSGHFTRERNTVVMYWAQICGQHNNQKRKTIGVYCT